MKRLILLDALRGFALMGIALANYPEFSLYSFLSGEEQSSMLTADADMITRWLQIIFVDGKFYTIFSILFGIGFSIIIENCMRKGRNGFVVFYRRMGVLTLIGLLHLLFLWSGDILLLYALMGMILPLFSKLNIRSLLIAASIFLFLPVICDLVITITLIDPSVYPYNMWWQTAASYGITENNFATWLRDTESYEGVHAFLIQGAWERMWEFVSSHRYFKVLGLFLIGYAIGKSKCLTSIEQHKQMLRKVAAWGFAIGLPLSVAYAFSQSMGAIPHSILYTLSVYPLGIAYMAFFSLIFVKTPKSKIWKCLSFPGRMSLTCYLSQSIIGIFLFYGIGLGWGLSFGLWQTEVISLAVFAAEMIFSAIWLRFFQYGPFEWIWRKLTYGRIISTTVN